MNRRKDEKDVLSPKENLFCEFYARVESEVFGRAGASAEKAGYSKKNRYVAASKLRKLPRVIARLQKIYAEALPFVGKVVTDLEALKIAAVQKGDLSTALRATELLGKHLGMFFERSVLTLDADTRFKYDERVAIEARRLSKIMLEQAGAAGLGALPALPALPVGRSGALPAAVEAQEPLTTEEL